MRKNRRTAAQTAGADQRDLPHETIGDNVIFDEEPLYDDCSTKPLMTISNIRTIGDLLNEADLTWGWFQGGYRPTRRAADNGGKAQCEARRPNAAGHSILDYSPHHNPVAYYVQFKNTPFGAEFAGDDRPQRPGHAPIRPRGFLGRGRQQRHAGGELSQGAGGAGRSRRLLGPAR